MDVKEDFFHLGVKALLRNNEGKTALVAAKYHQV